MALSKDFIVTGRVPKDFVAPSKVDYRPICPPAPQFYIPQKDWLSHEAATLMWLKTVMWRRYGTPGDAEIRITRFSVIASPTFAALSPMYALLDPDSPMRSFDSAVCTLVNVKPTRLAFKYAIFMEGCLVAKFHRSSAWEKVTRENPVLGFGDRDEGRICSVVACGYDKRGLYIENSWGKDWGEYGFARVPWDVFFSDCLGGEMISNSVNGIRKEMLNTK